MTVPSMVVDLSRPCGSMSNLSPGIHNLSIPCGSASVLVAGFLNISSIPSGASIFIDGTEQVGISTPSTFSVPEGDHTLTLKKTGYNDYNYPGLVTIIANQTTTISDIALVLAEGCVDFRTTPPGASIYIDDILRVETTPAIICGLSLGPHTYRLILTGYMDITGTVDLVTGHGEIIPGTFTPVVQAGFGAAGMFLIAGLGIGFLLLTRKRREEKSK